MISILKLWVHSNCEDAYSILYPLFIKDEGNQLSLNLKILTFGGQNLFFILLCNLKEIFPNSEISQLNLKME
jgi:hypothetical protein